MDLKNYSHILLILSLIACSPPIKREEDPSLSYKILYISNPVDDFDIYSVDLQGGNPVKLTDNAEWDWNPNFQSHSDKISFNSNRNEEFGIYTMNCDGSEREKALIQKNENYSYSPDGEWILFTDKTAGNDEIFIQSLTDSILINLSNHPLYDGRPVWSPDGKQIAFISDRDGDTEVYIIQTDGKGLVQLTHNARPEKYLDWKFDGKSLYVTSEFEGEDSEIFELFIDGGDPLQLTDNNYSESEISASPYNASLVYHREGSKQDQIYWLNLESWEHTQLTYDNAYHGEPEWVRCKD